MPASTSDLTALLRQTHLKSHDDILKAANASLKSSKSDETAQIARIVALLKTDRYADALKAFDEAGQSLKDKIPLELAYTLYKTGHLTKAKEVAEKHASDSNRGMLHAAAQINYRLQNFSASIAIYKSLAAGEGVVNEDNDLRINTSAVNAQLEWHGMGQLASNRKPQKEDMQAFERAYNAACACIARGELGQAEVLLNRAKQLCNASEYLSEEEKKEEIVPIEVQKLYVLSRLGKEDELLKLFDSMDTGSLSETSSRFLALSTKLSVQKDDNLFQIYKTYHSIVKGDSNDSPFQFQNDIILQNNFTTELSTLKFPGVLRATKTALSKPENLSPSTHINLSIFSAIAHAQNHSPKEALKTLTPKLKESPNNIGLLFVIAQLYIVVGKPSAAADILYTFYTRLPPSTSSSSSTTLPIATNTLAFSPALVATAIALLTTQRRASNARQILNLAAAHWRSPTTQVEPYAVPLLRDAAARLLDDAHPDGIARGRAIFEHLHRLDPLDATTNAGLVAARSASILAAAAATGSLADSHQASDSDSDSDRDLDPVLLAGLTPAADLVAHIDAAALEAAGVPRLDQQLQLQLGTKRGGGADNDDAHNGEPHKQGGSNSRKKRKLPASRMPKDFVQGKEMNSERWLPMKDRSYFRPKGRKGKGRAQSGTQGGGAQGGAEKLDGAKVSSSVVSAPLGTKKGKKKGKK